MIQYTRNFLINKFPLSPPPAKGEGKKEEYLDFKQCQ